MRWNTIRGNTIVSSDDAKSLGTVASLSMSFDDTATIDAFVVDDADGGRSMLPFSAVKSFGDDALVVDDPTTLRPSKSDIEDEAVLGAHQVIGKRVLTDTGGAMGTASDIEFSTNTGECERIILADDDLPAGRLLGVGSFAVIVSARRNSDGERVGDLDDLTKAELYDIARDVDLDGRSSMSKAELASALRNN